MHRAVILAVCAFCLVGHAGPQLEISPEMSVIEPTSLVLIRAGLKVPYSDLSGMRTYSLNVAKPVWVSDRWQLDAVGSIGYGAVSTVSGFQLNHQILSDSINLLWIPLTVQTHLQYLGFSVLKPGMHLGSGVQFFSQQGPIANLNQSYWVPEYSFGPDLTFFNSDPSELFSGFTFGITYHHSMASSQTWGAWSFDLAVDLQM